MGKCLLTVLPDYVKRVDNDGVIEERIENYLNDGAISSKLIVISGEHGIGKTSLIEKILDILKKQNCCVIHFDSEQQPIKEDYLCDAIVNMLKETGYDVKRDKQVQANNAKKLFPEVTVGLMDSPIVRVKLSPQDIYRYIRGLKKDTYLATVKNIEYANNLYVSELAQIIFAVYADIAKGLKNKNKMSFVQPCFYIVFDGFEDIEDKAATLIQRIMDQLMPNVSIIVTTNNSVTPNLVTNNLVNDLQKKCARDLMDAIFKQFKQENADFKSNVTFPLQPFAEPEVKKYLEYRQCDTSIQTIQTALVNSHGLPWLLSILCGKPEKFLVSSNPDITAFLKDYCTRFIFRQFSGYQHKIVLFALAANGGSIDVKVFEHFVKNGVKNDRIIVELIRKNVVKEGDGIYEFRIKQLSVTLCEIANSTTAGKEILKQCKRSLLESYTNFSSGEIVTKYHWYISIIRLMLDLNEKVQDIYTKAINGCDELIVNLQPDYGAEIVKLALEDYRLTPCQRIKLQHHKVCALYHSKKLDEAIDVYNQMCDDPENCELPSELWESTQYYVAKSYYYKNDPDNTIKLCNKITGIDDDTRPHNLDLYYTAGLLKIAALDLAGRYPLCFEEFNKLKAKAEQLDKTCAAYFSMAIQMISSTHLDCVDELERAIETFSPHDGDTDRGWACSQNNLGIEYLMQGEKLDKAKKHLQKSLEYFSGRIEEHFPRNNIGLYYQYFVPNGRKQARLHFKKAIQNAVSPLQQAYTRINLAILECQELNWEQGDELFKQAAKFVDKCPDPLAKSYFSYNYAMYLFKRGQIPQAQEYLKESCEKLWKHQVSNLFDKRQRLASQINCKISSNSSVAIGDRRKFFAEQEWEPCELMFYE